MNIVDTNFEGELATQIQEKKQAVLSQIIDKLSSDRDEEENMNASEILTALMDIKQFFTMISKRATLQKLAGNAFDEDGTVESKQASLELLSKFVQMYKEKQQQSYSPGDDSDNDMNKEDDEIIINEASDEEKDTVKDKADAALIEILANTIAPMKLALLNSRLPTVMNSLNMQEIKPFGITRLRIVELLAQLTKLNKPQISEAIQEHNMLAILISLVEMHPWNNFLQLKTQQIFEDLMESEVLTREEKFKLIKTSDVVEKLIKMSETPKCTFNSER